MMMTFRERRVSVALGLMVATALVAAGTWVARAQAADFGNDTYRGDDGPTGAGTKLRGRGHTFDVDPPRHPQTVTPRRESYKDTDRYAYRDKAESGTDYGDRYSDDTYRDDTYRGSLKDDPVVRDYRAPRHSSDRWRYRDHDVERWDEPDRCLRRRQIRRKLRRAGWRGMHFQRMRGNIGYIEARQRRTGEIYELAVDRCTGEVISAACIGRGDGRFGRRGVDFDDYRDNVVIRW